MTSRLFLGLVSAATLLGMSTPVVALTVPTPTGNEGKVSVRVAAIRSETVPGETLSVTIEIWNQDSRTQEDLTVSLRAEDARIALPQALPENGTFASPSTATWNIPELFAGRTWRVTLPVTIAADAAAGTPMTLTTRVSGDGVNPANSTLSAQTTLGVAVLPPTGMRLDGFTLIVSMLTAAAMAGLVRMRAVR